MILALQTTTFGAHGGIPSYNRMVCRALNELAESRDELKRTVLVATDNSSDVENAATLFPNLSIETFGGNRSSFAQRTTRIVLRHPVELLLIGHVNYAPLGPVLKSLRPSLRYGVMLHGVEVWRRLALPKRLGLQRADFVTAVSEFTRSSVAQLNGLKDERLHIVPDTIEWVGDGEAKESDSLLSDHGISSSATLLLSVGRLEATEKYKGIDTVISALPAVIERVPDVEYVVIGSGSDLARHKTLAAEVGVADRVHFLGSVDSQTLRSFYRACDVFVLPSDGEGFGIVYLEAMHYGKPVVAANSRAVPEVVKDNETGLLVEYQNVSKLSEAISSLCLDPDLRERMGTAGRLRLAEKFSFESFKQKFYTSILPGAALSQKILTDESAKRTSPAL